MKWPYLTTLPESEIDALNYLGTLPVGVNIRRFCIRTIENPYKEWYVEFQHLYPFEEYFDGNASAYDRKAAMDKAWQNCQENFKELNQYE